MIRRSNKEIATLAQISLVRGVFTAGTMSAPAFAHTSQATTPIGRCALLKFMSRLDTRLRTRTYSLITSC
jgi:hypothetical protein